VPDGLLDLVVPVYVHPDEAPHRWQRLASMADRVRIAVVNVHDGPGSGRDPAYLCAVHALRLSGIRVAGYVDTGYGRRTVTEVASDVAAYRRWYDLDAVFLDQVSSGLAELDHYADCVLGARSEGARFVTLNPGTHPHPGYVDLANLTVTFEGTWVDYRRLDVPSWVAARPASRFCHLVYDVPPWAFAEGVRLAGRRNVRSVFLSDGHGANPWDRCPTSLAEVMTRAGEQSWPDTG